MSAVADESGTGVDLPLAEVRAAAARLAGKVRRTPCESSRTFSRLCGGEVWFKYENLQRTGAYKLRGALNRVLTLPEEARRRGVIAASAGNHAQGVAVAAALAGVPATVVMPRTAPLAKVAATREYGARVVLHGDIFDDAQEEALRLVRAEGLTYVHPFDDPAIMAGQGTVALEILDDLPNAGTLVIPIGGGGLIAGMAATAKQLRPEIRVIGVQAKGANSTFLAYHDRYTGPLPAVNTIADGLATRAPGRLTLPLIRRYVDDVVEVDDTALTEAVVLLLERAKTIVEPAGAAALAALLSGAATPERWPTCVLLSGGNVDLNLIDRIVQRGLSAAGRHLRLRTRLPDRPGALQRLATVLAEGSANIVEVVHHRLGATLPVNEAELELTLEVRDQEHGRAVLAALERAGYVSVVL
ncbi:MAG TPA: threonine ammonia-lyase [Thermomicrobiales bacterium]|nr:threonine ammonia-lyase [Thermomicrobiales bacterium]